MRTRTIREGSAGLLILLGVCFFGAIALWIRGFNPANRTYTAIVEFASASGIQVGTAVRYRGVNVGKITAIRPGSNGVDVEIAISPADLIIPRDSVVEATQSGLIGETFVDILPIKSLPEGATTSKPLDSNCNNDVIVCHQSRLQGRAGASVDELIRASIRFTNMFSDPAVFNNIQAATKNTADAAAGVTRLTTEMTRLTQSVKQELGPLSSSARGTTNSISQAANQFSLTAYQINALLTANRTNLTTTLENLNQTSNQLRIATRQLSPVINRVEQGELLQNLELLSANAAQASANLRDLSNTLNDPNTVVRLQQTLDSARATFENAQKITADLDELTGDPGFRNNLRNLVNGLSGLVSSTQQLQQQAEFAQMLTPLAATTSTEAPAAPSTEPSLLLSSSEQKKLKSLTSTTVPVTLEAEAPLQQLMLPTTHVHSQREFKPQVSD